MPFTGGLTSDSPLLQPDFVDGVFDSYHPSEKRYAILDWYPTEEVDTYTIKWDEQSPLNFGLTKPVAPHAESPIIQGGHMKQFTITPGAFREKYVLRPDELIALRKLGTASETQAARDIVARRLLWLRERAQDRLEWLGWNALSGQIVISENNVNYTLDYSLPAHLDVTLTGAARWNQPSSANPINDIMDMLNLVIGYGFNYGSIWMNSTTAQVALQIDQFRDLFNSAVGGGQLARGVRAMGTLQEILVLHVPGMPPFKVWDAGYREETPTMADAIATDTSVVVDSVVNFAVGQNITIVHATDRTEQLLTIDGITAATKTISFTGTPLTAAYPQGSTIRLFQRYIPDAVVYFMPERSATVPGIGKTYLVPTEWGGSIEAPAPGLFAVTHVYEQSDPKRIELIAGFSGAPVPIYRNVYAKLTVW